MMKRFLPFFPLLLTMVACGSANEPFTVLGDPSATPQLGMPTTEAAIYNIGAYNASTVGTASDGFDLNLNQLTPMYGQNVVAPADGLIQSVDSGLNPGFFAVTVYHNLHLSTRVSRLQNATVVVGAYVKAGDILGTSPSTGTVLAHLSVFYDGQIVCPYSYLNAATRHSFNAKQFVDSKGLVIVSPCQE